MANMTINGTTIKIDEYFALELEYIDCLRLWLKFAKENRTCHNPYNSRKNLDRMLTDFFIEPKFTLYKSKALYTVLTGLLKKPLMDWKIADEEWFIQLDKHYKKLLLNSKLQQIEGDFING